MCGIVGFFSYGNESQRVNRSELIAVRDHMKKRGPDGSGVWVSPDQNVALAHRRLEIIGLGEQGSQPMELAQGCSGRSGSIVVTFNGEIYNYESIRANLEVRGHKFLSTSDTEVLLHLYEDCGPSMVTQLRGMYAFIIWDARKRELFLVRDPFGIKPLYYADDGQTLRAASQAKALLATGKISRSTNDASLASLLVLGSIPEPLTAWKEIRSVPAGSMMTIDSDGKRRIQEYYSLAATFQDANLIPKLSSTEAMVRESMLDTVRSHLISDVEVGIFLSAGIDSSSLLGLATEVHGPLHAVTIGFENYSGRSNDEVPLAKVVAETYGATHSIDMVTRTEFQSWLPLMFNDMDQPSVDGMNTWMASRSAANAGLKVVLSGIGGDELFGGYPSFTSVPTWSRRLRLPASIPGFGLSTRILLNHLLRQQSRPKFSSFLEYGDSLTHMWLLHRGISMPWEVAAIIGKDRANAALDELGLDSILNKAIDVDPGTDLGRVAALEGSLYMRNQLLRDADWAGMAHSVEIRVPLVDPELAKAISPLLLKTWGAGEGKRAISRCPVPPLPSDVSERSKTGFVVPIQDWSTNLPGYDSWRRVKSLAHENSPWARRWTYVVAEQFEML